MSRLPAQAANGNSTLISRPPTVSFNLFPLSLARPIGVTGTHPTLCQTWVLTAFADEGEEMPADRRELVAMSLSSVLLSVWAPFFSMNSLGAFGGYTAQQFARAGLMTKGHAAGSAIP